MKKEDNILEEKIKTDLNKGRYEFPEEEAKKNSLTDYLMVLIALVILIGIVMSILKIL